jgi:hypothetical protein
MAVDLPNSVEDLMEHKTRNQIGDVADILPSYLQTHPLSKRERLELWAEALENQGVRRLRTLFEIEYLPAAERALMRADDSPLSIAFSEPRLRAEGLAGDTIGDVAAFFGISERQLHDIVCSCLSGETVLAQTVATRIRAAVTKEAEHKSLLAVWVCGACLTAALSAIGIGLLPL